MSTTCAQPDDASAIAVAARNVLPVDDPAADAWRAVTRMIGWVCVVYGTLVFATFVIDLFGPRTMFSGVYGLPWNLRRRNLLAVVETGMQVWGLLLVCALLVGGIATVRRRRWGPAVLLGYALGSVPSLLWSVAWVVVTMINSSRQFPQGVPSAGYQAAMYALNSLTYLAFPAVVFYVMSRRPVRKQFAPIAPHSAFEPLPPTAAPEPAQA
jgi:hypothetical protein